MRRRIPTVNVAVYKQVEEEQRSVSRHGPFVSPHLFSAGLVGASWTPGPRPYKMDEG